MSIIYEALKKVESYKDSLPTPKTSSGLTDISKREEKLFLKRKLLTPAGIIAILILFFLYLATQHYLKKYFPKPLTPPQTQKGPLQAKESSLNLKNVVSQEESVQRKAGGEYILEGIVYDRESPFALINGKTLKKSDQIDEFVVKDITQDTVELINTRDNTALKLSF